MMFAFLLASSTSLMAWQETDKKQESDKSDAQAKEESKEDENSPKNQLKAIKKEIREFQSSQSKVMMEIREKHKDDQEKYIEAVTAWRKEMDAKIDSFMPKVLEVATRVDEDRKTSFEAITFVMSRASDSEQKSKAIDLLVQHHIDNEDLPNSLGMLGGGMPSSTTKKLYESLISKSDNKQLQGMAALSLAEHFKSLTRFQTMINDSPEFAKAYPEISEYIESVSEELTLDKLRERFAEISDTYKDLKPIKTRRPIRGMNPKKTIAELADASFKSFEKRALAKLRIAVGKTAPEIEGPDLDGESFKLSDYRGKVVLLDFWGDW